MKKITAIFYLIFTMITICFAALFYAGKNDLSKSAKRAGEAAKELALMLQKSGADSCKIPVSINGQIYLITVEEQYAAENGDAGYEM